MSDALLDISMSEIQRVVDAIAQTPSVEQYMLLPEEILANPKKLRLFMDPESLECRVEVEGDTTPALGDILELFELRLTMPDVDTVFPEIHEWMWDYIDQYEQVQWDWTQLSKTHTQAYVQIGGHASWAQGGFSDDFIAQVNNDVGDAGSVYIHSSFKAYVQMH